MCAVKGLNELLERSLQPKGRSCYQSEDIDNDLDWPDSGVVGDEDTERDCSNVKGMITRS